MQTWLLSTPPDLWQVRWLTVDWTCAPHLLGRGLMPAPLLQAVPTEDVSSGYLASLPTTKAVLSALRSAHTAQLAILQGSAAAAEQTAQISAGGPMFPSSHGGSFSRCGQYLAISYHSCDGQGSESRRFGITVCQAAGGFQQQTRFQACRLAPANCWAPDSPLLSIARLGASPVGGASAASQPAVLVFDAQAGRILHALGRQNESVFHALCQDQHQAGWPKLAWSPLGDMLMVSSRLHLPENATESHLAHGLLTIFDVKADMLVAQAQVSMANFSDQVIAAAVWHPSSRGIVLSYSVKLQHPAAFAACGLAVGSLLSFHRHLPFARRSEASRPEASRPQSD